MGMFDTIVCDCYLPNRPVGIKDFQTKSFGDEFSGGTMANYTITIDGRLIHHTVEMEWVPEEEREYYGKPEWDKGGLFQMMGCLRSVPTGDVTVNYHGFINMYGFDADDNWLEYELKFTDGKVVKVKQVSKESD